MQLVSKTWIALLIGALALAVAGCEAAGRAEQSDPTGVDTADTAGTATGTDDGTDSGFANSTDTSGGGQGCDAMDILFVVDQSQSMTQEQQSLADSFPKFIEVLDAYRNPAGKAITYRVGVTSSGVERTYREKNGFMTTQVDSSNLGTVNDGLLLGQGKCNLPQAWLEGPSATTAKSFACMAELGTSGSTTEMPFAALEMALGEQAQADKPNAGFYRAGGSSLLVVVVITDEEDCSIDNGGVMVLDDNARPCIDQGSKGLYTPARVKAFLDTTAGGVGRYVVVTIAGPKPGDCATPGNAPDECVSSSGGAFGTARYGARVHAITEALGEAAYFGDISKGDLWKNLEAALTLIQSSCSALAPIV